MLMNLANPLELATLEEENPTEVDKMCVHQMLQKLVRWGVDKLGDWPEGNIRVMNFRETVQKRRFSCRTMEPGVQLTRDR